jgi:hypothetical protein
MQTDTNETESVLDRHIARNWEDYERARLKQKRGLKTGFNEIDKILIALPGLVNIMGDTNCFKSTLVTNIILNNAKEGHPVILCDNENGLTRTRTRMLCILGNLEPGAIESNNWQAGEKERYLAAVDELISLPIFFLDYLSEDEIQESVAVVGKAYKKHVLLIVDSLHAFTSGGENEKEELTKWVNFFNTLKNKHDGWLTIVFICEKSKAQYGANANGSKGSGSIDYRSECTINMYPTRDRAGTVLDCIKGRDSPKGIISILLPSKPFTYRLEEREYLPEELGE